MAFHTGPDMGASKSSRPQSGINSKGVGTIKPGSVSPGTKALHLWQRPIVAR